MSQNESTHAQPPAWYLIVAIVFIVGLWLASPWLILGWLPHEGGDWQTSGTFGDSFGALNSLFSGLALAGLVYTIFLQRHEISMQREEMTRSENNANDQKVDLKEQVKDGKRAIMLGSQPLIFVEPALGVQSFFMASQEFNLKKNEIMHKREFSIILGQHNVSTYPAIGVIVEMTIMRNDHNMETESVLNRIRCLASNGLAKVSLRADVIDTSALKMTVVGNRIFLHLEIKFKIWFKNTCNGHFVTSQRFSLYIENAVLYDKWCASMNEYNLHMATPSNIQKVKPNNFKQEVDLIEDVSFFDQQLVDESKYEEALQRLRAAESITGMSIQRNEDQNENARP